jgi:hypothetical protein
VVLVGLAFEAQGEMAGVEADLEGGGLAAHSRGFLVNTRCRKLGPSSCSGLRLTRGLAAGGAPGPA